MSVPIAEEIPKCVSEPVAEVPLLAGFSPRQVNPCAPGPWPPTGPLVFVDGRPGAAGFVVPIVEPGDIHRQSAGLAWHRAPPVGVPEQMPRPGRRERLLGSRSLGRGCYMRSREWWLNTTLPCVAPPGQRLCVACSRIRASSRARPRAGARAREIVRGGRPPPPKRMEGRTLLER
jgi:hypothetical protein